MTVHANTPLASITIGVKIAVAVVLAVSGVVWTGAMYIGDLKLTDQVLLSRIEAHNSVDEQRMKTVEAAVLRIEGNVKAQQQVLNNILLELRDKR